MLEEKNEENENIEVHILKKSNESFKNWLVFSFGICIILILIAVSYLF